MYIRKTRQDIARGNGTWGGNPRTCLNYVITTLDPIRRATKHGWSQNISDGDRSTMDFNINAWRHWLPICRRFVASLLG